MSRHSIKARLLIGLLASLTLVLAGGVAGLYWFQRELLTQEFDSQLDRRAFAVSREMRHDGDSGRPGSETQPTPTLPDGVAFAAIWDLTSNTLDKQLPPGLTLNLNSIKAPGESDAPEFQTVRLANGTVSRVIARRTGPSFARGPRRADRRRERPETQQATSEPQDASAERDRPTRARVLLVGADMAPLQARLRDWLMMLLAAGASGELLVVTVVLIAVRRGLRPLRALEADIASMGDGDLTRRISAQRLPRELQPMVRQLNDLLARLEQAFDRERAFTASAAHEFRTPLAAIRTQMEVCLRRPRADQEYQRTLAVCLEGALALQRMVDLMLDLARLDGDQMKPLAETIDVATLVADQCKRVELTAGDRGCTVRKTLPPVDFCTDRLMLEHVVANLLSNAAEYADTGGMVNVVMEMSGRHLHLRVSNPASACEPSDVARLFDPFWRKDAARTAVGHHAGLGLTIVKRCVRALGGSVEAILLDGILSFQVQLPPLNEAISPAAEPVKALTDLK